MVRIKPSDRSSGLITEDWSNPILEPIEVERASFANFVVAHNLEHVCAKVHTVGDEEAFFDGTKSALSKLDYLIIDIHGPAMKRGLPSRISREGQYSAYYVNDYKLEHSLFGEYGHVQPFYYWLFCVERPDGLREKLAGTKFQVIDATASESASRKL